MTNKFTSTMESLDLPKELYWDTKLEPVSPLTAVASELFGLDDPAATFLYDDNFANGMTVLSAEYADALQEAVCNELLSGEDLVVEFMDLKDEGKLTKLDD